ncbi:hypothetical protein [Thorsellia kenyensis]|uniref:AEC family transporter n=1 Tax=Thorsellia kenyensis TaxID=1549888 RepID=A0ABV6C7U7_9GAMM
MFSIFPIFLLIISGFLSKKFFINNDVFWSYIDKLVYYLFFPALLVLEINAAVFSSEVIKGIVVTSVSTVLVAIVLFFTKPLIKSNRLFTSLFQGSIRYNSYIFLALSASLFSEKGVAIAGVFIAYMIVITNVMSVVVMNLYGDSDNKKMHLLSLLLFLKIL